MDESIVSSKENIIEKASGIVPDAEKGSNGYAASEKYFENTACPYYPCHKVPADAEGKVHMNCLFCYCPMYHLKECPGNPRFKEKNGRIIKVCTDCTFPHEKDNYDEIMRRIRENNNSSIPDPSNS